MVGKVVDHPKRDTARTPAPVSDFWFAQLDVRLGRIEFMVSRLEWQIWMIVCGGFGLLVYEIVKALAGK
ncbi:MAG: hypothetical protein MUR46_05155 [Loktanella sp.]|jgi:hypothetical protein|nr:hypothetical protein [Loktanella sp.]MDO7623643.1 hypothetical protein [Loktanella sp.]MDO7627125.1 hypothetical protein [Loktanella sp.]MDO7666748.1 hypothetical protein [Loktanella sp.]MDO7685675.1 hypothetical protein [Loktanella sp.]